MTALSSDSRPYDALAAVYDRWTADADHERWAAFIHSKLGGLALRAPTVLDLCCGTGRMTRLLAERGYQLTGVDRSPAMLGIARRSVPAGTALIEAELPELPAADASFSAVVCCFDSVNYFVTADGLDRLLGVVHRVLHPGGLFMFDVNTRYKLETVFGSSHYGDDRGDFAYVWRNRCHPAEQRTEFLITLFTRDGSRFVRHEEIHQQRWFSHVDLVVAATAHGFEVVSVTDDYTDTPTSPTTLRETWVLRSTVPK